MRSLDSLAKVRSDAEALTREMGALKATLKVLEGRQPSTMTDADFCELKDGWYRYDKMKTRLSELRRDGDESSYFLSTGNILFKYYDIIDNKNEPSSSCAYPKDRRNAASASASGKKSVISYFTASEGSSSRAVPSASAGGSGSACDDPSVTVNEMTRVVEDRASLFDKYMQRVAKASNPTVVHDECQHCGSDHRTLQPQDGYIYCNSCSTIEYVLVDHEKPAYKDPPKEVTHFAYKRINHLNEWLNQVQGKETTDIPEEVYDRILLEVKKQKINNMAMLTRKSVKEILKKLKINKYYEHIPHIINRLNGIPMPQLPSNLEDRVRQMFCQIQVPFLKHAPPHRKNFLSYSYCLNKMMQLLEEDQYLESFPLLKSREKLHQQDVIWQKICAELGWDFIPSL